MTGYSIIEVEITSSVMAPAEELSVGQSPAEDYTGINSKLTAKSIFATVVLGGKPVNP